MEKKPSATTKTDKEFTFSREKKKTNVRNSI
jgi:hypothetical protein